jgi:hypothetical protein
VPTTPVQAALTAAHRARVDLVTGELLKRISAAARAADVTDIDAWWAKQGPGLNAIVRQGSRATGGLTVAYLRAHASASGLRIDPQLYAALVDQINVSMNVTGPVAFKTAMSVHSGNEAVALRTMVTTLTGSSERLIRAGSRDTVAGALRDGQIAGYRRVHGSSERSCAFCSMLIGRGAVYDADTAEFHAHDHDRCSAEPLYEQEIEPPAVVALGDQWAQVTSGLSGADAVRAWRTHWATV